MSDKHPDKDDCQRAFESEYLDGNSWSTQKNSTTGEYVHASIGDAWAGWQACWKYLNEESRN